MLSKTAPSINTDFKEQIICVTFSPTKQSIIDTRNQLNRILNNWDEQKAFAYALEIVKTGISTYYVLHTDFVGLTNLLPELGTVLSRLQPNQLKQIRNQYDKIARMVMRSTSYRVRPYHFHAQQWKNLCLSDNQKAEILQTGGVVVLSGQMGTGKTQDFAAPLAYHANANGYQVFVIVHRRSLSNSLCERFSIMNYTLKNNDSEASYEEVATLERKGMSIVINSLSESRFTSVLEQNRARGQKSFVFVDEAAQVHRALSSRNISGRKMKPIVDEFRKLINHADLLVLADANFNDAILTNYAKMRGKEESFRLINSINPFNEKKVFNIIPFSSQSSTTANFDFIANSIFEYIKPGKGAVFCSNTKLSCDLLEQTLLNANPKLKILKITSETNESAEVKAFTADNSLCDLYDVILYSPSITSGVHICSDKFTTVWSYYTHTTITYSDCEQQMARVRSARTFNLYLCTRSKRQFNSINNADLASLLHEFYPDNQNVSHLSLIDDIHNVNTAFEEDSKCYFPQRLICSLMLAGYQVNIDNSQYLTPEVESECLKELSDEQKQKRIDCLLNANLLTHKDYIELKKSETKEPQDIYDIEAHNISRKLLLPLDQRLTIQDIEMFGNERGVKARNHLAVLAKVSNNIARAERELDSNLPIHRMTHPIQSETLIDKFFQLLFDCTWSKFTYDKGFDTALKDNGVYRGCLSDERVDNVVKFIHKKLPYLVLCRFPVGEFYKTENRQRFHTIIDLKNKVIPITPANPRAAVKKLYERLGLKIDKITLPNNRTKSYLFVLNQESFEYNLAYLQRQAEVTKRIDEHEANMKQLLAEIESKHSAEIDQKAIDKQISEMASSMANNMFFLHQFRSEQLGSNTNAVVCSRCHCVAINEDNCPVCRNKTFTPIIKVDLFDEVEVKQIINQYAREFVSSNLPGIKMGLYEHTNG